MDWKTRSAYVFIKTKDGKAQNVWQRFHNWENVIGAWMVTGEWDVIIWIDAQDWNAIHDCVNTIKDWDDVEFTSSHWVFDGFKNENWWWEKSAGTWVLFRENKLSTTSEKIKQWNWATSGASIPGEWDYIAWIQGENWDEVWNHLADIKEQNWQAIPCVPIKSWWNQTWKDKWW